MKILHIAIPDFHLVVERARRKISGAAEMIIHFPDTPGFVVASTAGAADRGVRPAMLLEKARELAPDAVLAEADFQSYGQVSEQLNAELREIHPFTEQIDVCEWFIDLTDEPGPADLAALSGRLCARYPFSLKSGEGPNKFLAKLATETGNPFGGPDTHRRLSQVPVEHFWGIPQRWIKEFRQMGIETIGEVGGVDPAILEKKFPNAGARLARLGRGDDDHEVHPFSKPTKLTRNGRARLTTDEAQTRSFLQGLAGEISEQLQKGGHAAFAMVLEITGGGQRVSHRYRFLVPTERASALAAGAETMLQKMRAMIPDGVALDMGLSVCEIIPDRETYQLHGSPRADLEVLTD